jgi:hypothetical protein
MLNKYMFDDSMFEFRQMEKIFSSPKIKTGSEPPSSYLVGTGAVGAGVKGGQKVTQQLPLHPAPILGMGGVNLHLQSPTRLHGAYREKFIF